VGSKRRSRLSSNANVPETQRIKVINSRYLSLFLREKGKIRIKQEAGMVGHTCNPNFLGGRDGRSRSPRNKT
jgi:hypothetical protein